ncbi:MAG: hypothetical protein AAB869_00350 [Patescibacteria group bacterium]
MKHIGITIFSALVFLLVAFFPRGLSFLSTPVSRETSVPERYRKTLSVEQGVSQDGLLTVTKIPHAPSVPPRAKPANHARTLRAFFAPDSGGVLTLYIESIKPHGYYLITGGFTISGDYPVLTWDTETTLAFYSMSSKGELMRYAADVHLITLSVRPVDSTTSIPTKILPSMDLLP